jgi:hypothetical protein
MDERGSEALTRTDWDTSIFIRLRVRRGGRRLQAGLWRLRCGEQCSNIFGPDDSVLAPARPLNRDGSWIAIRDTILIRCSKHVYRAQMDQPQASLLINHVQTLWNYPLAHTAPLTINPLLSRTGIPPISTQSLHPTTSGPSPLSHHSTT